MNSFVRELCIWILIFTFLMYSDLCGGYFLVAFIYTASLFCFRLIIWLIVTLAKEKPITDTHKQCIHCQSLIPKLATVCFKCTRDV